MTGMTVMFLGIPPITVPPYLNPINWWHSAETFTVSNVEKIIEYCIYLVIGVKRYFMKRFQMLLNMADPDMLPDAVARGTNMRAKTGILALRREIILLSISLPSMFEEIAGVCPCGIEYEHCEEDERHGKFEQCARVTIGCRDHQQLADAVVVSHETSDQESCAKSQCRPPYGVQYPFSGRREYLYYAPEQRPGKEGHERNPRIYGNPVVLERYHRVYQHCSNHGQEGKHRYEDRADLPVRPVRP